MRCAKCTYGGPGCLKCRDRLAQKGDIDAETTREEDRKELSSPEREEPRSRRPRDGEARGGSPAEAHRSSREGGEEGREEKEEAHRQKLDEALAKAGLSIAISVILMDAAAAVLKPIAAHDYEKVASITNAAADLIRTLTETSRNGIGDA